jgi:hypothetical protein
VLGEIPADHHELSAVKELVAVSRAENPLVARVVVREITEQAIKTMKKRGLLGK